jgi:biotin operon repressor
MTTTTATRTRRTSTGPASRAGKPARAATPRTAARARGAAPVPTTSPRRTASAKPAPATGATATTATGTTTDERIRAALTAADGGLSVEQLAAATGLGKSTVAKALTRLETTGLAVRTRGAGTGRNRQPDQWTPAAGPKPAAGTPRRRATRAATASPAKASPAQTGPQPAGERNPVTGTARLRSGELTQLVAEHFANHPGTPLTSGEVGRALGRSGGAVRNAADKLTTEGVLRLLDGAPRRYTLVA